MPPLRPVAFCIVAIIATVAVLATLAACSPLAALNVLTPRSGYERITAPYGPHPRHTLDIYKPDSQTGGAPVVLFFHGGSWNSGDRSRYTFVGEALASRGIVAVVANYRLYPEVRYPAFLEDGAMAAAWTFKNVHLHGGNSARLFVMGHSSGAYNAAMLALDERWLRAVDLAPDMFNGWIGLAGPYDFIPIENPDVKPVFFHPDTPPASQPITHVNAAVPPTLLIAAGDDEVVNPVRNTGAMVKRLRDAGVQVREIRYDGLGHAVLIGAFALPLRPLAPVLDDVVRFIEERSE